ncbi:MAG TPA: hypothetical protein VFO46_25000 [Candidatus Sulfotelmatobacter sp.]|nr:hypothetical protein [Candidatus Sulfotelmatobacter sp.]
MRVGLRKVDSRIERCSLECKLLAFWRSPLVCDEAVEFDPWAVELCETDPPPL